MTGIPRIHKPIGGAAAVLLALLGQWQLQNQHLFDAMLFLGVTVCWFVIVFAKSEPAVSHDSSHSIPVWGYPTATAIGVLGGTLGAIALGVLAWREFDLAEVSMRAWWLYAASVALFLLIAVLPYLALRSPTSGLIGRWNTQWPDLGWLLTIVLIALVTRLYLIGELPFGTWYDEAANGLEALRILNEAQYRPIYTDGVNSSGHYLFLVAGALKLFGTTTVAVRMVSVLMGIGTVLAGYLVGRELFGRSGGLIAAFLLAVSRWAINISRLGMYNASTPLFELLALAFLLRGLRRNRTSDYALAGVSVGLGLCFYSAYQLFVGVLILFLVVLVVVARGTIRASIPGILVMIVGALLVVSPIVKFAYENPERYYSRIQDTSLFGDKLPEERLPSFLDNLRKHALMFNYRGDPNGRHNIPGEPMLDTVSGALFLLGLGLCLWRVRRPQYALLLMWLFLSLMGGVLSLDFEAPQSLRSVGALPAAYMIAVIPLVEIRQVWRTSGSRQYPRVFPIFALALLIPLAAINIDAYFRRQAKDFASWNAFSTPETIAARLLSDLDSRTDAYVISFFDGHPTLRFLARDGVRYERLETTDRLPLPLSADRDVVIILDAERRALFDDARRLYPEADFEEIRPPFGGPVVVNYVHLSPSDLSSVQGLAGKYFAGDDWIGMPDVAQQDMSIDFDWSKEAPLPLPFHAEWEGVLVAHTFGPYQFALEAPGRAQLFLGEKLIVDKREGGPEEPDIALVLARGNHAIRVRTQGGSGKLRLSWRPPDRDWGIIPPSSLYVPPVSANGLLGRYFTNGTWSEPEAMSSIDPMLDMYFHAPPLARPYTVEWEGKIAIPESGHYAFGLQSIDESKLFIDGLEVASSEDRSQYGEGSLEMVEGLHDIRVRFADRSDHTYISLFWTPPSLQAPERRQLIPTEVLFPPQADYDRVTIPDFASLEASRGYSANRQEASEPVGRYTEIVVAGLDSPAGLALTADGSVIVAEPDKGRVRAFSPSGTVLAELDPDGIEFGEPYAVAIDRSGYIYILDSGDGRVSVFDPAYAHVYDLNADAALLRRARGIHVDGDGRIWVASTATGRIIAFDQSGNIARELPVTISGVGSGAIAQPVDVLVTETSDIFVADAGVHKILWYSADGSRRLAWDVAVANTREGSHLALDGNGNLYFTEPELGIVVFLDVNGNAVRHWTVRDGELHNAKPVGIAVGENDDVWLADSENGRLLRMQGAE